MTSSKRCARSSSVPSCTSVSSCARLWRSARSLTDEKIAAANANSRNVAALTERDAVGHRGLVLHEVGFRGRVREQQQEGAPDRELDPRAIRDEDGDRHDVEEHQEAQRADVTTGHRDRERDHEAVDEDGARQQRGHALRCPAPHQLHRARHQRVGERERHQLDVRVTDEERDDQNRRPLRSDAPVAAPGGDHRVPPTASGASASSKSRPSLAVGRRSELRVAAVDAAVEREEQQHQEHEQHDEPSVADGLHDERRGGGHGTRA